MVTLLPVGFTTTAERYYLAVADQFIEVLRPDISRGIIGK